MNEYYKRLLQVERRKRASLFPPDSSCARCGLRDVLVFEQQHGIILCADCAAIERGKAPLEGHHVFSKRTPLIIAVSANEHRIFNLLQRWRGPSVDPISRTPYGLAELFVVSELALEWKRTANVNRGVRSSLSRE